MKVLLIMLGGGLGSLLRYGISGLLYRFSYGIFPWGTIGVNLIGSFLIGFIWQMSERLTLSPDIRTFLFIGLLGGFTTFSTYSLETFSLFREGEIGLAIFNMLFSNIIGIALVFLGFMSARYFLGLFR